jgi:hypothetical protein
MRYGLLMSALLLALSAGACRQLNTGRLSVNPQQSAVLAFASTAKKPDFATEIKPIFQTRCQPCHFPGGKVYDKMPFDKPETITKLGPKLFTRIKDEKEKRLISDFLNRP